MSSKAFILQSPQASKSPLSVATGRQLLRVRARDVRLQRSARVPQKTFATECPTARVRHGELLPITSRKIMCWHFAPMAETTHTSGSRLSALLCLQVYRGSGDWVYRGVRSIMACEDGSSDRIHGLPLETPRTANVLLRIMRARPHARGSATAISQQITSDAAQQQEA